MIRAGSCPVLSNSNVIKLRASGFRTVIDFVSTDKEEISKKATIPYKDIISIERVLLAQYSAFPRNGLNLYEELVTSVAILSTGCESLDKLLDEGIYTSEVTEIAGSPGSGKSQICMNAAATLSVTSKQNVLYLDTGGNFDIDRISEIICEKCLEIEEQEDALRRIQCKTAFTIFDLLTEIEDLKLILNENVDLFYDSLKLVVVDNIASIISPILGGQQTDGHGYMMHAATALKSLASKYSLSVLITNNLVQGDPPRPALGRTWASFPNTRLQILHTSKDPSQIGNKDVTDNTRKIVLTKSSRQPVGSIVEFQIAPGGVCDVSTKVRKRVY